MQDVMTKGKCSRCILKKHRVLCLLKDAYAYAYVDLIYYKFPIENHIPHVILLEC